jgi:PAS domain S-box-containing protein
MNNNGEGNAVAADDKTTNFNDVFQAVDIPQIAIHSANAGVWIIDTATRNFLPSRRTKELFGYLPEEDMSLAQAMAQIVEKHRKAVLEAMESAFRNRGNLDIDYPVTSYHDQQQRWLNVTGGFSDTDTSNTYFSGLIMDITSRKQNDLRRSKFIGIVSHELKTPLTALKAYVQLLNSWAKKQKDNFTIGALSKVDRQVRKMLNMINSLLNFSGAESGKIHLNKQEFVLNDLITEVIEETLFITASHEIVMTPCEPVIINADRDKIEQVLVNLLSNAAKYGGKETPIEISCAKITGQVEVSVKDQGLGIEKEDIEKLFLPHHRVENKETEKINGFGIGLYLCSEIIQRHKGKIWVESEAGKGSTFKFTVPLT